MIQSRGLGWWWWGAVVNLAPLSAVYLCLQCLIAGLAVGLAGKVSTKEAK